MRLKGGLSSQLLVGAGMMMAAGCSGHSAASLVPKSTGSGTTSVHQSFQTVVHKTKFENTYSQGQAAMSVAYVGRVTTIKTALSNTGGITYDPDDKNLYALEDNAQAGVWSIVRVSPTGVTSTFAALPGYASEIVYDHANLTFYVTTGPGSLGNGLRAAGVFAISSTGAVTTLAGGGTGDGTGGNAGFGEPTGITVDPVNGLLYVVDGSVVRSITTGGTVTTITPTGVIGNGWAYNPMGITYDPKDGNLYVADSTLQTIHRVTTSGGVSTFAGTCLKLQSVGQCDPMEREGPATSALFATPTSIQSDPVTGDLYVADSGNNAIRKITRAGVVSTLAGSGVQSESDGVGLSAEFNHPETIAINGTSMYGLDVSPSFGTAALRKIVVRGSVPVPTPQKITFFYTPSLEAFPYSISSSSASQYLWITERSISRVARVATDGSMTEFAVSAQPDSLALGSDGTPWFTTDGSGGIHIAHMDSAGHVSSWPIRNAFGDGPRNLALGPDGNMWFVKMTTNGILLGNATSSGVITTHKFGVQLSGAPELTFSSDGKAWISDGYRGYEVNTSSWGLTTVAYPLYASTKGPDGNPWFTQFWNESAIGEVVPSTGVVEVFPIIAPVPGCTSSDICNRMMTAIAPGPDGALWVTANESLTNVTFTAIGRLTTAGVYSEYQVPAARSNLNAVAAGPDGNVWFVDSGAQKIGVVHLH